MFHRVSGVCWRQLLQFSSLCIMCCKMCVTVALCLSFLFAFSEGFFIPASLRKQGPQTTYSSQQWIPSQSINPNNAATTAQGNYGNPKDYNPYQQQPQPLQQTQQQHQQQLLQPQAAYSSQIYTVQATAPKYEPTPFQSVNQPQYSYDGIYPAPLNSYSQSVQLVPCLCPVNKEVIEQQTQQLQQQNSIPVSPTTAPFSTDTNNNAAAPPPQTNQKKA